MTIAEDFDQILEVGGGDLKVQWPKLVRAVKSLRDWGVNMDAGAIDAPATAAATNILAVGASSVGIGAAAGADRLLIDNGASAIDVRIRSTGAAASSLLLENSAATWRMFTSATGPWALQDAVAGTQPIQVQEGANNNALFIDDAGHIGFGLDPTATFDFIAALGDADIWRFQAGDATANFQINAGATTGHNADLNLLGEFSTRWTLRKNTAEQFEIRSTAGATVLMEAAAPATSLYIDADGHVGFGINPNAFAFAVQGTGSVWRFHNVADTQSFLDIGAGSTAENAVDLRWVDRLGIRQWALRKEAGNRLALVDNAGNGPFIVEQGAALNALYIDSTAHVGLGIANPGTHFYVANDDNLGNTIGNETEVAVFEETFASGGNNGRLRINGIRRAVGTTWGGSGFRLEANIDDNATAQCWIELIHPDDTDLADHYISFGEASGTEWGRFHNGKFGVGTGAEPNAAAIIQADSTTQGLLPPRMTTTQRDNISSPPDGLLVYNSSTNALNLRASSAWTAFLTLSANTTEESADRTANSTESAFTQMANISFPGATNGSTDYLVILTCTCDNPSASVNLNLRIRMGQNGTTADAVQAQFIHVQELLGVGEYTVTGHTVVTPAANDVLTVSHQTSSGTVLLVGSNADGRTCRVTIFELPT